MIPYGRQSLDDEDIQAVVDVLKSDFLTCGPAVEDFEQALQNFTGASHAVVCNSGTAALHLAMMALGIRSGDTVIVPSLTFLASANAALYVGANVCFADVDPDTGLVTAETLQKALEECKDANVKAVVVVHLNGSVVDINEISKLTKPLGIRIIEDACHALGGRYLGSEPFVSVGASALSDLTCFSFHPVKTVAMGEGGAVTTNRRELAVEMCALRSHGMTRNANQFVHKDDAYDEDGSVNPWYYEMQSLGYNYRASDLNCALGTSQLRKAPMFLEKRRSLAERYFDKLSSLYPRVKPVPNREIDADGWHLFPVLFNWEQVKKTRAQIVAELKRSGVGTQVHYYPVHRQPFYVNLNGEKNLHGADAYYERVLSLPLFPDLQLHQVDEIVCALASVLEEG